jgi:hypothetical protein
MSDELSGSDCMLLLPCASSCAAAATKSHRALPLLPRLQGAWSSEGADCWPVSSDPSACLCSRLSITSASWTFIPKIVHAPATLKVTLARFEAKRRSDDECIRSTAAQVYQVESWFSVVFMCSYVSAAVWGGVIWLEVNMLLPTCLAVTIDLQCRSCHAAV